MTEFTVDIRDAQGNPLEWDRLTITAIREAAPAPEPEPEPAPPPEPVPAPAPRRTWAPLGSLPLADGDAAALVTRKPETRAKNAAANAYVPSDAELEAFRTAKDHRGLTQPAMNPLARHITGRHGLSSPSTDDLIQWCAQKWGIPEDIVRAQMVAESWWSQDAVGDRRTVTAAVYSQHPPQARIAGTSEVYESLGISQIKWRPGTLNPGVEPLRWRSTAFNLDYYGASIRFYFDDPNGARSGWGDASYVKGQEWNSIGAHFSPYPWGNAGQAGYIAKVKDRLAKRTWEQVGF